MKLSFHGADRGVTGSCHLIKSAGHHVLIDCGLYQGSRELDEENGEPFGFDPSTIDQLLLTHAHLDHCGRLPLLVKRGFRGEIITTAASRELSRLVLLDSAHLQEEEAAWRSRRAARHKHHPAEIRPLYSILDALNTFEFFGRTAVYDQPLKLADGIRATFLDAGHILGSASILVQLEEGDHARRVLFSGDLGALDAHCSALPPRRLKWTWWSWKRPMAIGCTGNCSRRSTNFMTRSTTVFSAAAMSSYQRSLWSARRSFCIFCMKALKSAV